MYRRAPRRPEPHHRRRAGHGDGRRRRFNTTGAARRPRRGRQPGEPAARRCLATPRSIAGVLANRLRTILAVGSRGKPAQLTAEDSLRALLLARSDTIGFDPSRAYEFHDLGFATSRGGVSALINCGALEHARHTYCAGATGPLLVFHTNGGTVGRSVFHVVEALCVGMANIPLGIACIGRELSRTVDKFDPRSTAWYQDTNAASATKWWARAVVEPP